MIERELRLKLRATTPMFLNGADNQTPEVRAPAVRGALRFWLRAALGATGQNWEEVKKKESKILGDTSASSLVAIRFGPIANHSPRMGPRHLLPHRLGTDRNPSPATAYLEESQFELCIRPMPGHTVPRELLAALLLWLNLGGVGKRSRRGMGNLELMAAPQITGLTLPQDAIGLFKTTVSDGNALAMHVRQVLRGSVRTSSELAPRPAFPNFAPNHSQVLVCKTPFVDEPPYTRALLDFWHKKLRSTVSLSDLPNGLRDDRAYGFARSQERRASPVFLHISRSDAGDHIVLTAFESEPSPVGEQGWRKVHRLLEECAKEWNGEFVWGGP